jgi:hypothetical protein
MRWHEPFDPPANEQIRSQSVPLIADSSAFTPLQTRLRLP